MSNKFAAAAVIACYVPSLGAQSKHQGDTSDAEQLRDNPVREATIDKTWKLPDTEMITAN
jgi:hypothetical protein